MVYITLPVISYCWMFNWHHRPKCRRRRHLSEVSPRLSPCRHNVSQTSILSIFRPKEDLCFELSGKTMVRFELLTVVRHGWNAFYQVEMLKPAGQRDTLSIGNRIWNMYFWTSQSQIWVFLICLDLFVFHQERIKWRNPYDPTSRMRDNPSAKPKCTFL